ncbi:MAG: hypothetical protein PUK70_06120 [Bacteroidales bacterium]|nr:hypothetical protein [Bacteroidales bacterium]MDY6001355.1 hypothetical protein [Candidatus Cryptobacteroides sp.]
MKKILYILFAITLALSSCVKEDGSSAGAKLPDPEGVGVINVKIEIPETAIATRALSENFDFTTSTLHLAVFDGSTLSEYALAESVGTTTGEVDGKTVTLYQFTVNLTLNSSPIHLHMILNGPDNLSYGYEDELMSKLSVSGNTPAYWGYVDLPDGITAKQEWNSTTQSYEYVKEDGKYVVDDAVVEKFQKVPMVRNFAWLTVGTSSSVTNFTLDGIVLLNEPKGGTIAPYNRSNHAFMTDYKIYDYSGIVSAYSGNMLNSETFDGTVPDDADFVDPSSGVFMYERTVPIGTQAKTTILARGKYNGETVYYKLDLADADGYYTIYRNFHYNITITNVAKKGSTTIADAIQSGGTADPTTDTEISSLDDISNGVNRLYVQYVDTTVTSALDMVLRFKFIPDINNSSVVDNGDPVTLTVGKKGVYGEAIEGSTCTKASFDETYGGSSGWRQVSFKTTAPGSSEKSQTITVTGTSNNSSVKIVVTVRVLPKQTLSVECVNGDAAKVSSRRNAISDTIAAPLDVRTTIPVGLSESIFPLVFDIEVVKKSLTPRAGAYLPVISRKSYSSSGKATYMFQRTLTYSEYKSIAASDTKVTFSSIFKSNIAASTSEVYVANKYFNTGSASFTNYHVAKFSNLRYYYSYTNNSDGTQTAKVSSFSFDMEDGYVLDEEGYWIPVHVYIEGGTADEAPMLTKDVLSGEGWYIYTPYNYDPAYKTFNIVPDSDATSIYVQLSTDELSEVEYETAELRNNASFEMSTVKFNTNNDYFRLLDNAETINGITLTFNNIFYSFNNRISLKDGIFTVASENKNIARVEINYYSTSKYTYGPQSVTADSGTFYDDYTDWRTHGNLVNSVTFAMDANEHSGTRTSISSIVVYLAN